MNLVNAKRGFVVTLWIFIVASAGVAGDWSIQTPQKDQTFTTASDVAGSGQAPDAPTPFVFKIVKYVNNVPVTMQSVSGTSQGNSVKKWEATCECPAGGWNNGNNVDAHAVLRSGDQDQDDKPIHFMNNM